MNTSTTSLTAWLSNLSTVLRSYLFDIDSHRDPALGYRLFPNVIPVFRLSPNLSMPVENDIHGLGLGNDLCPTINLDIVGAVKLLAKDQ